MASRTRYELGGSTDVVQCIGSGRRGHLDGDDHDAELNRPFGVCALRDGVLAFTDAHNNAVRFVIRDGGASKARRKWCVKTMGSSGLLTPKGIAASADERHLFVCDTGHHKIRLAALPSRSVLADVDRITDGVEMFAFAGNGKKGWRDGAALEASFNAPAGICEHVDGTIIVADTGNHCIRQIRRAANGKLVVKTIAGGYAGLEVAGGGHHRLRGDSKAARPRGEILVADTMNNCIRGLSQPASKGPPWKVSTICGRITPGYADGNCAVALFDQPMGLCWGANRNTFFVSDRGNACIRQVGRSVDGLGDCLSFSWVLTIEVGAVPRTLRSARNQDSVPHSLPLGIVCILEQSAEREEAPSPKLVVCDGGDNLIKLLPVEEVEQRTFDVGKNERFGALKVSEARPVSTTSRQSTGSSLRDESAGSRSPSPECFDSDDPSENQCGDDCGKCSCGSSRALERALEANAALEAENLRLRELLECTFEEIELADKRFTQNYKASK